MVDLIKAKRGPLGGAAWHRSCGAWRNFAVVSRLILASASPRPFPAVARYRLDFEVIPSNVSEEEVNGVGPADLVMRLAYAKAADVAQGLTRGSLSGADTIVVSDSRVLGKPVDSDDAFSNAACALSIRRTRFTREFR